jgi:hypothetical protein
MTCLRPIQIVPRFRPLAGIKMKNEAHRFFTIVLFTELQHSLPLSAISVGHNLNLSNCFFSLCLG